MATPPRKVAAIQLATGPNVAANLMKVERLVAEAASSGASLVVLPENFGFMGEHDRDLLGHREQPGDGPLQHFLAQTASRYGVWIVGGTVPLITEDPDKVRAACLLFDDRGRQVARYDKIHLFDVQVPGSNESYAESKIIEPGGEAVVVDSPLGRLGLAVCYDLRFPEIFRCLVDRGMQVLVLPASFTAVTGRAHWEILVRARAIENLSYVVAAGQGGYHVSGRETFGHSMIVDPWGAILAQAPRGSVCVMAKLDLDLQDSIRRSFPTLEHRRLKCEPAIPKT
jgi:nitrilase